MGNICCQLKRPKRESSSIQVMPVEEYEYSHVFFLGDLEENKIFIYSG